MTAVMEYPMETAPRSGGPSEPLDLPRLLAEQGRMLAEQQRMLELLDARREQIDELVVDLLPVINAVMVMTMRFTERVGAENVGQVVGSLAEEWNDIRRAPAPGTLSLVNRLRNPAVRRAAALVLAGLAAAGSAVGAPELTTLKRRTT